MYMVFHLSKSEKLKMTINFHYNNNQLTTEILNPGLNGLGRLSLLDVPQSLVQQHVASGLVILTDHFPVGQTPPPHTSFLQFHTATQRQLDQDTSTQTRGDAVVPE